ncbi:MAG: hypothetical protein HKP30_05320, partial [Myxococcales bacterium]|nr:hypothetical protein [Myxococcales bacterium]
MPPRFVRAAGLALALWALGLPAAAQNAATEEESRRLRRGGATAGVVRDAGEEAAELARFAGEDVSYADVLADPDDIATSYQWARRQVREGELRGAAATLERILLLRPDLAAVRLLYAVVLYRLDSLAEASRQLEILSDGPLRPAERAEVARYQKTLRRASRRTRFDTSLSFGTNYETNRNSAPMSGTRQIQLGPARLELGLLPE